MSQTGLACNETELEVSGDRTVVVGVKLDSQSRELLTWALVKVAQPGDRVIALHVLSNNETVDRDGKSSLLSLVKAFDSVLAVYEGFCNLKQVDLKLKICRGSSVRKILVREAKSYFATEIIVGTARNHHTIRSSVSVAKYCGRKLPKDCSVLAVNNGKVVFQRVASPATNGGIEDHHWNGLLSAIQRKLGKNSKILNDGNGDMKPVTTCDQGTCGNLELALVKASSDCAETALKQNCSICSPDSVVPDNSCAQSLESSSNGDEDCSMAIVPVQKLEAASSSISLLIRELPELRPGWPLLRRAILSNQQSSGRSSGRQISVVQWTLRLPGRHCLPIANSDQKESSCDGDEDRSSNLDGESGAIVPVGTETVIAPDSLDHSLSSLPKELEGLHEKYTATCRLFQYQELKSATLNFMPGNLIGKGGSSQVYQGCLPDGKELAVKILKPSEDVLKEFVLEIEIITALHHKNIISLFGFCFEDNNLLLVYDFLSRGSLEENLHSNKDPLAFGWTERFKVAVGVAEALDYLHNRIPKPVIHRDVKSSNILLSDDFEPQLSDFGLAKWASTTSSHITCTDVSGTFGYLAPEYFMYGKVNDKIDVYAFGVVLLELLSGRKPISSDYPKGQESLVMWAKPILNSGKVAQLLDSNLGNNYDGDQIERMVLAATLCIRRAPRARPQMSLVVKLLQGDAEVTKWARLQVNASEGSDMLDDEAFPRSNLQSHLNLALLDVEEDSLSMSSIEQSVSLEDYLQGRWSRSSSFD
uniref:Protein kinase domain-containing protein n=1 Tax=Davidia involucrata TaxID=16924 RepID=A0A5B7BMW9_DAVIN